MKNEIMNLINSEDGTFRLNNISKLHRWTKTALNENVDKLRIEFDAINGIDFSGIYDIKCRNFEGIIEECEKATSDFLGRVSAKLTANIKNGYVNKH